MLNMVHLFPHLKVMFSVGGWDNSYQFKKMTRDKETRCNFIRSVIKIIDKWSFDGVDLAWFYPGANTTRSSAYKTKYVKLMKELRIALDSHQRQKGRSSRYLISFAGSNSKDILEKGYNLPELLKYADWVNVMSFDYFAQMSYNWGSITGPPAPLYHGTPGEIYPAELNVDWTLNYYSCQISNMDKIVMGIPFYGRYYPNVTSSVDPADGMWRLSLNRDSQLDQGVKSYDMIKHNWLNKAGYERVLHGKTKTPYLLNEKLKVFIGYEDEVSLKYKMDYVLQNNLSGVVIWSIDYDDGWMTMLNTVSTTHMCTNNQNYHGKNSSCSPSQESRPRSLPEQDETSSPVNKENEIDDNMDEKIVMKKLWWDWSDGQDKSGKCGPSAQKINGQIAQCDPNSDYPCCSKWGMCGGSDQHCNCDHCIDYRKQSPRSASNPKETTRSTDMSKINTKPDKLWWDWSDGQDKSGKCGPNAPKINGQNAQCDPNSEWPCCSPYGMCGGSDQHCNCDQCIDYRNRI